MKKVAYILNLAAIFVACNDNDSVITVPLPEGTLNCTQLQKELGIDEKNWIPTKNGCALDDEGQSKAKSKMTTLKEQLLNSGDWTFDLSYCDDESTCYGFRTTYDANEFCLVYDYNEKKQVLNSASLQICQKDLVEPNTSNSEKTSSSSGKETKSSSSTKKESPASSSSKEKNPPVSSSSSRTPVEQPESSSSRDDNVVIRPKSSTSAPIIDTTVNPVSSSAVMEEIKGLAACAPVLQAGQTGIDKGTAAKWKITPNSKSGFTMNDYLKADVVWNFAGEGINTTTETLVGVSGPEVTYTNSGDFPATATITMGMKTETVACTPLHVNGAPITSCKCTAAAPRVDIALGEVGEWTVSGCQSQAAIIDYEWNGTDPGMTGESATLTFTEKNVVATPTVTVINDDNTKATFECAAVMSTNSDDPDYKLSFEGNQVPSNAKVYVDVPTGKETCVQVSFDWTGTWTPTGISMKCDLKVSDNVQGLKMDITYNGKTTSFKGDYKISNEGISLGSVTQGLNNKGDVCITATVNGSPTSARCYFSN